MFQSHFLPPRHLFWMSDLNKAQVRRTKSERNRWRKFMWQSLIFQFFGARAGGVRPNDQKSRDFVPLKGLEILCSTFTDIFCHKNENASTDFPHNFSLPKNIFHFLPGISPASYFTPGNPYHLGSHLSSQTSPQANQQVFFWKHSMIRCLCLHFSSKPHRIPHHSSLCIPQLLRLLVRASFIGKLRNVKTWMIAGNRLRSCTNVEEKFYSKKCEIAGRLLLSNLRTNP